MTETRPAADLLRELREERVRREEDRRRLGIVRLSDQMLAHLFDLPDGYEIVSVHADWDTRSVCAMVRSDDLDVVVPGAVPPTIPGAAFPEVRIITEEDGEQTAWYRMRLVPRPTCRGCGCTDEDCSQCVERTGTPCHWVEPDLCSACAAEQLVAGVLARGTQTEGEPECVVCEQIADHRVHIDPDEKGHHAFALAMVGP